MAATGAFALVAATLKPSGTRPMRSPWLAQTPISLGSPSKRGLPGSARTVACPNSRSGAGSTSPPRMSAINCMP